MVNLSPEDREALEDFGCECDLARRCSCDAEMVTAVEAIVARHVAAALTEASLACDRKATEWAEEYAESDADADYGRWDAWENAAHIVRAAIPPP